MAFAEAAMKSKRRLTPFMRRARELGADEAKEVRADSVVTAPWVRLKCHGLVLID